MKNEIIDNDFIIGKEESKMNELNKNNDISTTKEEESFIADEPIQYCSSPKTGLVSINISNNNNDTFTPVPAEKINITNTITMNISILDNKISLKDVKRTKMRSTTTHKKEIDIINKEICNTNKKILENIKDFKGKLMLKEKKNEFRNSGKIKKYINTPIDSLGRTNLNSLLKDTNKTIIKKKLSHNKKKKRARKNEEKCEEKLVKQNRRFSFENNTKKRKKKNKKNKKEIYSKKKIKPGYNEENEKDAKDKDHSTNIIILDFSSSDNKEDSDGSDNNVSIEENKSLKNKENINNNEKFNKIDDEDAFFKNRQRTIIINNNSYEMKKKKEFIAIKKFIKPKSKQSDCLGSSHKVSNMKILPQPTNKKSINCNKDNSTRLKSYTKQMCPNNIITNKANTKDKEKETKEFFKILNPKILFNKNNERDKPTKVRHSFWKNLSTNHSSEKIRSKIKQKNSHQSYKFLNKEYKSNINLNSENERINKIIEKKDKINYLNKSNKNLSLKSLNKTPKSKIKNKDSYESNNNLTKITINPLTAENKDIHLVFEGKQETIINYTNQNMVDDENEYMVECLKVLLKLKMEEQPRCKTKVNFNFPPEEDSKKIALFDLDETLVHCTKDKKGLNGDVVNVKLPTNKTVSVGLNIRSHWKEALDLIKSHYHIVVYTASHQSYADAVLNYLDKENKYFQYRLYRNHCVQCDVEGIKFYVKDLDTLSKYYNLKDVVLIDNSVLSFAYHLNNGIPIVPFVEQKDDTQLLMLAYYLLSIASFDDLTQENKKHINIEHFLLMAKKLAEEEELEEEENDKEEDNNKSKNIDNNDKEKEKENNNENIIKENSEIKNEESQKEIDNMNKSDKLIKSNKFLKKKSENAIKIAEDMKKNLDGIYKTNYN